MAGVPDEGVIEGAIGKVLTPEGHHRVALVSEAAGGRAASTGTACWTPPIPAAPLAPRTGRAPSSASTSRRSAPVGRRAHGGAAHERLCLHSAKLAFAHPATKRPVAFESGAPFDAAGKNTKAPPYAGA